MREPMVAIPPTTASKQEVIRIASQLRRNKNRAAVMHMQMLISPAMKAIVSIMGFGIFAELLHSFSDSPRLTH